MIVRIIIKSGCKKCAGYLKMLDKKRFSYETLNVSTPDDKTKELLDAWRIKEIPVVQITDDEQNRVHYQFPPGTFSPRVINSRIKELESSGF